MPSTVVPAHVLQTQDINADKLFRLRSNRVLYSAPPPYTGIGRPHVHGDKFKLNGSIKARAITLTGLSCTNCSKMDDSILTPQRDLIS